MKLPLTVAALLASTATVRADPFQVNVCDAGVVPGSIGNPVTWTPALGSFQDSRGSSGVFPPAPEGPLTPSEMYDNYFSMDPAGPPLPGDGNPNTIGDGYITIVSLGAVNPGASGSTTTMSGFRAGIAQGVWFSTAFITSGDQVSIPDGTYTGNLTGIQHMFVLNLTLRPGASPPTTNGLVVNIRDGADIDQPTANGSLGPLRFGLANASNNGGRWHQSYYLDYLTRTVSGINATFNGGTSYAIYIVAVPEPGAGVIGAFLTMLLAPRRRPLT